MSTLAYKRTNVYEKADEKLLKEIFDYAEGYKKYLDEGKTEREACASAKRMAVENGYKPFKFGQKLKAGDKVYEGYHIAESGNTGRSTDTEIKGRESYH